LPPSEFFRQKGPHDKHLQRIGWTTQGHTWNSHPSAFCRTHKKRQTTKK